MPPAEVRRSTPHGDGTYERTTSAGSVPCRAWVFIRPLARSILGGGRSSGIGYPADCRLASAPSSRLTDQGRQAFTDSASKEGIDLLRERDAVDGD